MDPSFLQRPTRCGVAALLLLLASLAACSNGDSAAGRGELTERLTAARTQIDQAESLDISLSTDRVPDGTTGLLSANGKANHDPAFSGDVTVVTGGTSLDAEVISVAGKVYVKTRFAPRFMTMDPTSIGAPDPADLLSTDRGVGQILQKTEQLSDGGRSRDGSDVLTTIDGRLAGKVIKDVLPSADADDSFTVSYRLDEDNSLRDATIDGPFYPDAPDVSYKLTLRTSPKPVEIAAPAKTGGR